MGKYGMDEEINGVPEPGDTIRTTKMQMEGKVEKVVKSSAGYDEVMFRIADGRLMKTPLSNVTVVEKLSDENIVMEVAGERVDEISTELLAKYKTAAGKDASDADKKGNVTRGNKRFSGIVKATKKQFDNDSKKNTKEGSMGCINRVPNLGLSYEKVLDEVMQKWSSEKLDELSVGKLRAYKDAASSPDVIRRAPLRKVVKHVQGANTAGQKIAAKTGDRTGIKQPGTGTMEEKLQNFLDEADPCWKGYKQYGTKDKAGRQVPNCVPTKEDIDPWHGYTPDDKKANALSRAPRSTMQGSTDVPFSKLVQDTIKTHGVKYAFEYYVKKHGLPPRQFQIFAGLTVKPRAK
jgi:hypothetical protein